MRHTRRHRALLAEGGQRAIDGARAVGAGRHHHVRELKVAGESELGLDGRVATAHHAHVLVVEQGLLVVVGRQLVVKAEHQIDLAARELGRRLLQRPRP